MFAEAIFGHICPNCHREYEPYQPPLRLGNVRLDNLLERMEAMEEFIRKQKEST